MLILIIVLWLLIGIIMWIYRFLKYIHIKEMFNAVYDLKLFEGKKEMVRRLKTNVLLILLSLLLIPFWPISFVIWKFFPSILL